MSEKRWEPAPAAPQNILRTYRGIHPIIAQLLYNRGLQTPKEAEHFLYDKDIASTSIDPRNMKDMRKAIARIRQAIENKESIVVYGDFDADGVTSTALMMDVLTKLKANATPYIPHRVDEGYGLNTPALQKLAQEGADLVITVDCGIRSVQEVQEGNTAGLDIIITDHHSIGPEIPPALAVVNPQREDCPGDPKLAGVGVAFMVARALLLEAYDRNGRNKQHLKTYTELLDNLLDLVAIGTVADIMPLNTPTNRAIVRRGLDVINRAERPGVAALMDVAGIKPGQATAMSIGFGLGPRLNAAGRLESAMIAYELLSVPKAHKQRGMTEAQYRSQLETTQQQAAAFAQELQGLNTRRQQLTRAAQERVQMQLDQRGGDDHLIFAVDDEVVPGIVGLVAGRLTQEYYRPAVVVECSNGDECHASCRSIPEFHITQALDACADLLVRHGGHAMAAGLTVLPENIDALRQHLQQAAQDALEGKELRPTLSVDMELSLREVTLELAGELAVLEPTGHGNPQALFVTRDLHVLEKKSVGNGSSHLKLKLGQEGVAPVDAIGFRLGHWLEDMPERIDVAYHLEINEWQGRRNLQLNLQDIRPAEAAV